MKRSSRLWSADYSTSFVIVSQKLMQSLTEGRITFNKVSKIVHCSQKALQLFAHSGNGKSSIDCIFVSDICNPFSDTTLPTNSSSEKPKKHLEAFI